ncbi:type IV pilus modification PilV family protein [Synoicihabitans lomoniglobus]|uniref:Type II secretion system protein n=1 Tax=Synoicihabitans lomoniglobus TaxID=2909285 RepID=A0AAF0CPM0_9BACT|nr:type II secretion system GspH family protein [Opitutaceae bacterium LMO-M01]WED65449.1 type II secretion system protein [Opitutaceae bacterium LMO-M01]
MKANQPSSPPTLYGRAKTKCRRAFTLIEVMAATGVLSMALSSAVIVIQAGLSNLDTARTSTAASQMIQSEMERIRLLNWTNISALPAEEVLDISEFHTAGTIAGDRLEIVRRVSDVAGYASEMKEIDITATWTAISGRELSRVFRMRYARNGLFDYYYNHAQN